MVFTESSHSNLLGLDGLSDVCGELIDRGVVNWFVQFVLGEKILLGR